MRELIVSSATFGSMVGALIQSGVTFEAQETAQGTIRVTFTGGF